MIMIDGTPAHVVVARAIASGLIQPPKPKNWKPPEEQTRYKELLRKRTRECMRRLREQRRAARAAQEKAQAEQCEVAA